MLYRYCLNACQKRLIDDWLDFCNSVSRRYHMQVHNQIKFQRDRLKMSQEELADKIYVSRQSISNWERGKNYPDLHSLIALSQLFEISLDTLIKGDVEIMKERIEENNRLEFNKSSQMFTLLFLGILVLAPILVMLLGVKGLVLWLILYSFVMMYAVQVEKMKQLYDIQTYKEIAAFMDGEPLDSINREIRPSKYISNSIKFGFGTLIGLVVGYGGIVIFNILFK